MRPGRWIALGALCGLAAVTLGAFGAHGLKGRIPPERLSAFETGARYAMVHALALVAVGTLAERRDSGRLRAAGWAFAIGIALFSGSLMLLAVTGAKALGRVAPAGGLALMAGWVCLAWEGIRRG